ncbi:MAG: YncE family protein [Nitrospirae bacterium]|nr:YncE family protein [Nitrospirota bacterium]
MTHGRITGPAQTGVLLVLCGWLTACSLAPFSLAPRAPLAYITNTESDSVTVLDTETDKVVTVIEEIKRPLDVHGALDGNKVYVGGEGRTVVIIDPKSQTVTQRLDVGQATTSLALSSDGRALYVSDVKTGTVSVIATATNQLLARVAAIPMPMAIVPTPFPKFYVASYYSGTVKVVSIFQNRVLDSIPVGEFPIGMAVSPNGLYAYVTNQHFRSVSVIDTRTDRVVTTIDVEGNPTGIAVSPDGGRAYVANAGSGTLSVIALNTDRVIASIPVGEFPWGVAVTPDGRKVYVTNMGSDTISVIDAATHRVTATLQGAWKNPTGIAIVRP